MEREVSEGAQRVIHNREPGVEATSLWWQLQHSWSVRVILLVIRRDPRCRRSDRVEATALLFAVVVSVLAIPLAVLVGMTLFHASLATVHRQAMDRRPVLATVVPDARPRSASSLRASSTATVAWRGPQERLIREVVPVVGSPKVGSHLTIWTASDGRWVPAPLTRAQAEGYAYAVGIALALGILSLTYLLLVLVRRSLLRRRVRAWDAAWIEIGKTPGRVEGPSGRGPSDPEE